MSNDFKERAVEWSKGNYFESFQKGQSFDHHWGRTINESDNSLFTTLTLHFNPLYFNREYAQENGHKDIQINPLLVFNTILGLSVEDLSEAGGPFVGIEKLVYGVPVYAGDTITAKSTTIDARLSESKRGFGIVTWKTQGCNQNDEVVITFERSNLIMTQVFADQVKAMQEVKS
jgi:acyl dehydratase